MIIKNKNENDIVTIKITIPFDDLPIYKNLDPFCTSFKLVFNNNKIIKITCCIILPDGPPTTDPYKIVCTNCFKWENEQFEGYSTGTYKIDLDDTFENRVNNALFNVGEWSIYTITRSRHGQHFSSLSINDDIKEKIKEMVKICHDEINNPLIKSAVKCY